MHCSTGALQNALFGLLRAALQGVADGKFLLEQLDVANRQPDETEQHWTFNHPELLEETSGRMSKKSFGQRPQARRADNQSNTYYLKYEGRSKYGEERALQHLQRCHVAEHKLYNRTARCDRAGKLDAVRTMQCELESLHMRWAGSATWTHARHQKGNSNILA